MKIVQFLLSEETLLLKANIEPKDTTNLFDTRINKRCLKVFLSLTRVFATEML